VWFNFLGLVFVNYPSALTIGWRVCGSMRRLPIGTFEMSVTAQTIPDVPDEQLEVDDGSAPVASVPISTEDTVTAPDPPPPTTPPPPDDMGGATRLWLIMDGWFNSGVCLSLP